MFTKKDEKKDKRKVGDGTLWIKIYIKFTKNLMKKNMNLCSLIFLCVVSHQS